jgi:Cof subfamily protein (haloacid dehalogenase superfamily)
MTKETDAGGILLIAVDLDGTLMTSEGVLAPEGARLLKKAAHDGVHIVLATTRNPDSVQAFCRSLEIDDPIICTNGAQVWGSPDGPVWAYHSIPQETALAIARLADANNWELSTTIGSMTYWRQRPDQALGPIAPDITVVARNSDAIVDNPVRILTWHPEAADSIQSLCQSKFASQCYAETYLRPDGALHSLGVFALQANKGTALALVLNRLGLKQQRVMAIGDNLNDLPMFAYARVSVAMSNAPAQVKQKATIVAPSNDEEGVAWALMASGVS